MKLLGPHGCLNAFGFFLAALGASSAFSEGDAKALVTFSRDIVPILQNHCQVCHRPGQIAPMSLVTYAEVRPWAKSIRTVVSERTMPPFHVNAPLGYFKDDNRLNDDQIALMTKWIDAGAPQGDPATAPPQPVWPAEGWLFGEPDQVLTYAKYSPNTENRDEVIVFFSDYVFEKDTWLQSIEFKSTNYKLLHHAGVYAIGPEVFVPEDLILNENDEHLDKFGGMSSGGFAGMKDRPHLYTWLPGQQYNRRAEGDGFLVKAGHRLAIQMHIAPTAERVEFQISLGLHFVNGQITANTIPRLGRIKEITIPPGADNYVLRTEVRFENPRTIIGFNTHMHVRGKSMQIVFHYPDGRSDVMFDVPRFNFDWQRDYYLSTPIQVPAGTRAEIIGKWDNSAANPLNPDPTAEVHWGSHNTDEMFDSLIYVAEARIKPLRVVKGIVQP